MTDDLKKIQDALSQCYLDSDPIFERLEQMVDFNSSFEFSSGDNATVWPNRKTAIKAVCGNCGFKWVSGFMPMPKLQLNCVLERSGFCVRCCESEKVFFQEVAIVKTPSPSGSCTGQNAPPLATKTPTFRHVTK